MTDLHPVQAIVVSHPSVRTALDRIEPLGSLSHDLLVEAAPSSWIAPSLGLTAWPSRERGVASLLARHADPHALAVHLDGVPGSVLLAGATPIPDTDFRYGLARLAAIPGPHRAVTLLITADDVPRLGGVAAQLSRVAVLWHIHDAPSSALIDAIAHLDREGALGGDRWAGLHLVGEDPALADRVRVVLDDFPALAVLHGGAA